MRPAPRLRIWTAAILAAALLVLPSPPLAAQRLRPLGGVDQLKAWFNENRAHPRLVLLLSPT